MHVKEAVLQSLEHFSEKSELATFQMVYDKIVEDKLELDVNDLTPAYISTSLAKFHSDNDQRVRRVQNPGYRGKGHARYVYYRSNYEQNFDKILQQGNLEQNHNETIDDLAESVLAETNKKTARTKNRSTAPEPVASYLEKDLHILLASYLGGTENILAKTIPHNQSNKNDNAQTWTHPDMVGVKFAKFNSGSTNKLMNLVNNSNSFQIYSYEIKKEIQTDYELKQAYFQAVSNSSWANYGYLVAYEISDNLKKEIERLNQSFGIGCIVLNSNPYKSEIRHYASYKELDFVTMDKLCGQNDTFNQFIQGIHSVVAAPEGYYESTLNAFTRCRDEILETDQAIEEYIKEKGIPNEEIVSD